MADPSIVQQAFYQNLEPNPNPSVAFTSSVTKGNYLLVVLRFRASSGASPTLDDSRHNIWAPIYADSTQAVFIATAKDSGACTINGHYQADYFAFDVDLLILEIASAGATVSSNSNSGVGSAATISTGGVSVTQNLFGFPSSEDAWAAAMVNFNNPDGVATDGLTLAVFFSREGFGPSLPSGWTNQFPLPYEPTYTEVLVGPGDVGLPPPPSGGPCPAACQTNLSDTNPAAPAAGINVRWQKSSAYLDPHNAQESIRDVSAYVPKATANSYGVVQLGGNDVAIEVNGTPVSTDYVVTVNSFFDVNGAQLWP